MAELYNPLSGPEECPDCGSGLVLLEHQGLQAGCPECIPDGLLEQYAAGFRFVEDE